jgi:hypothetical protein
MRFLLLGEYSGLHQALSDGLLKNGHDVVWYHDGDNKKKISGGKRFFLKTGIRIFDIFLKNTIPFLKISKEDNFDCVHFISPIILSPRIFTNKLFIKFALKKSRFSILAAAGTDSIYLDYCKDFRYNPIESIIQEEGKFSSVYQREDVKKNNYFLARCVDVIVAYAYDYYYPYSKTKWLSKLHFSPMPVITDDLDIPQININQITTILLGANKKSFKGYRLMLNAITLLKEEFKEDIIIDIPNFVSSDDWQIKLAKCSILLDQCFSYSPGMNALKGLAMGKIVLSGSEIEFEKMINVESPIINITPNVKQIYSCLKLLITNPNLMLQYSEKSIDYVKKNHSSEIVANNICSIVNHAIRNG